MDIGLASPIAVFAAIVAIPVACAIKVESGSPVLFWQVRVGQGGIAIRVPKFRSMPVDSPSLPSSDAHGIPTTKVGAFIRRTNLDELPQIWNVLGGSMSLVGPRPSLPTQIELVEMRNRGGALAVKPGLTGLAQVMAYDGMPNQEKAHWDAVYARNVSLLNDLRILMKTFGYLRKRPPRY